MPKTKETAAVSIRNVEVEVWNQFKKLAMIQDMTIQEYLKYLVEKESERVQISIKRK